MSPPAEIHADRAALETEIAGLGPWHHDVEIAPGLWTADVAPSTPYPDDLGPVSILRPSRVLSQRLDSIYPNGLEGRTFLDCACNAGGYLFAARELGAGRCFGFDVREHWIRQARFLAKHLPSEGIEVEQFGLEALAERGLQPFDVTLFSGILYHLPDPVAGLRIAADLTREIIVVSTEMKSVRGNVLTLTQESDTYIMSGVHRLAWHPSTPQVVAAMLAWCGFPHYRLYHQTRPGPGGYYRLMIAAAREADAFRHLDAVERPRPSRAGRLLARLGLRARGTPHAG